MIAIPLRPRIEYIAYYVCNPDTKILFVTTNDAQGVIEWGKAYKALFEAGVSYLPAQIHRASVVMVDNRMAGMVSPQMMPTQVPVKLFKDA